MASVSISQSLSITNPSPCQGKAHDADLMGIGAHCKVASCSRVDFLPFKCDACGQSFCLEHRTYAGHACPKAGSKETEVIVCPLCAKGVRLNGRDANMVFHEHQTSGDCDPDNYQKVHKKPRCPVVGASGQQCKEKLTTVNCYTCNGCGQKICMKHRLPDDHGCAAAKAKASAQQRDNWAGKPAQPVTQPRTQPRTSSSVFGNPAFNNAAFARSVSQSISLNNAPSGALASVRNSSNNGSSSLTTSNSMNRARVQQQPVDPGNTVRGTADRRRLQPTTSQEVAGATANTTAQAGGLTELCPQCGARFSSAERLVQHVEDFHPPGSTASLTTASHTPIAISHSIDNERELLNERDLFRCPHCSQEFADPVVLLRHSRRCSPAAADFGRNRNRDSQATKSDCCIQ